MTEEETRKRLGIALAILGFVIMCIKGASAVGHYLVVWSIPSGTAVGITVAAIDEAITGVEDFTVGSVAQFERGVSGHHAAKSRPSQCTASHSFRQ